MEPVSAFAVYAAKRKNTEQLLSNKKRRKQKAFDKKRKDVKQASVKKEMQCKGVLNKPKLKVMNEENKKNKKAAKKRETIQIIHAKSKYVRTESRENSLNDTNSSHLNNISYPINASIEINDGHRDPVKDCQQLFKWLVHPLNVEDFFKQNWEKTPVYIKRDTCNFYTFLLSSATLDATLRNNNVLFTKNIDITSYSNGVRETHNPFGRAYASVVWDYFRNKCSVRMLNPQTFIPKIHALNATLQEFFGCFVGANIYLTPPNSQGFAPHYDDVEAFILQVEGEKRWKLYKPLKQNEYLPRYSSKNFDQSEIGEPIMDTVVKAGDLLYLPRGTIHQGMTRDTHSLHITLSVYQRNSWCDLLEKVLPQALKRAIKKDIRFREGLPLNYLTYVGSAYDVSCRKDAFKNEVKKLITVLLEYIDVDNAADLMAKGHIHDSLPPYIFTSDRRCTILEDGDVPGFNRLVKRYGEIRLSTEIRLLRLHCIRLIKEDKVYKIYYSTENSKEYHEYEPQYLDIDKEFVPAIKQMIASYPNFISVKELLIQDADTKIQVVKDLWEKNIIMTKVPLNEVGF